MLKMWRGLGSVVVLLSGLLGLPEIALADRATVVLKDGRSFEGELAEYFPGDHVTLVLADARRQQIAASELASVKVHPALGPAPTPAPAAEPAPAVLATFPQPPAAAAAPPLSEIAAPNNLDQAQYIGARGRLQLGLSAPLIRYSSFTRSGNNQPDQESSSVQWGLLRAPVVELGYGLSDVFVIGVAAQLSGESNSSSVSDTSAFGIFIGPKLDLQLDTSTRFKPFVGVALGLSYSSSENAPKGTGLGVLTASNSQTTTFRMQARVGVRCFVTDDVSLDLALAGGFDTGSSTAAVTSATGVTSQSPKLDASGSFFGLYLGTSIWPGVS